MAESTAHVLRTFAARADAYEQESAWVTADRFITPLVPEPPSRGPRPIFLDLCAGTGCVARAAAAAGWHTVALDRSPEMLARLGSPAVLALVADAARIPCRDRSVDVAVIRQGLHYFEGDGVLRELRRVTRREIRLGHITLYDARDAGWWTRYYAIASPGRRRVFEPGALARLVQGIGLHVTQTQVIESIESFAGPTAHLDEAQRTAVADLWRSAPAALRHRHHATRNAGAATLTVRWEFVVGAL